MRVRTDSPVSFSLARWLFWSEKYSHYLEALTLLAAMFILKSIHVELESPEVHSSPEEPFFVAIPLCHSPTQYS